ncbi:MAG: hypothetical protein ABSF21_06365, partial [Dehalococcoidia bacterium]
MPIAKDDTRGTFIGTQEMTEETKESREGGNIYKMKKGILMLGIVLALMAVTAISGGVAAGSVGNTTLVTGSIVEATVTVTAPSAIAFGMFVVGDNIQQSTTDGT